MKKLILIAAVSLAALSSCKKSSSSEVTPQDKFVGRWNWEGSTSSAQQTTPQTAGYTETLSLNANNTYVINRNTAVAERGRYDITADNRSTGTQQLHVIKFAFQNEEQSISVSADGNTLMITKPTGAVNVSSRYTRVP